MREVTGDPGFQLTYARHRVEAGSALAGLTYQTATIEPAGTILSLTLIDKQFAEPGHRGDRGVGRAPRAGHACRRRPGLPADPRHSGTAPFGEHARTRYRRHLW